MLSQVDAYAIAKAMAGKPADHLLGVSLPTQILCNVISVHKLDMERLTLFMPDENLRKQVFGLNPEHDPVKEVETEPLVIPNLPKSARLTEDQLRQAQTTGQWIRDYVTWAGGTANQTPLSFHQGAAIWLAAVVIGRRCYTVTPWRQRVFPNFYIMSIAPSTYYRKSTGFNLAQEWVREHLPHMVMSEAGSPESFLNMLAGNLPSNFEDLNETDQARLKASQKYAAQRGLVRDEMSGLFKAMQKDYMAGMKEHLMLMYDCPTFYDIQTVSKGLVVIRNVALSMIGAATPAELSLAIGANDWLNGNLARFILLVPESDYAERVAHTHYEPPQGLLEQWQAVYHALPEPPDPTSKDQTRVEWQLAAQGKFWSLVKGYEAALRSMTDPKRGLDAYLTANYGRLHIHALKLAMVAAVYDWVADQRTSQPVLEERHWFFAQQMAEDWRAYMHQAFADLSKTKEVKLEERVMSILKMNPKGLTARDIYRAIHSNQKQVYEALKGLTDDGRVMAIEAIRRGKNIALYIPSDDKS